MTRKPLELYVHIPFCVKKCAYCDFLSGPSTLKLREAYVNCLTEEIRLCEHDGSENSACRWAPCDPEKYEVVSVFFGGGTPSILAPDQIRRIMEALREAYDWNPQAEVTIEANPGTVDEEKLRTYLDCGINRISFGLQSTNNEELRNLGRIHTWEEFLESYQKARAAGFTNINVDLMSALPGQTVDSWRETLEKVLELKPEHISAYSLIIEEGTPFYEKYEDHPELMPPEDEERQMYHDTKRILHEHGYERYEISNYAKAGYACRHNLGYWERTEYKGFGLGSASLLENTRYTNTRELEQYLKGQIEGTKEELSGQDIREETFFLGLRKMEGIDPGPYRAHYEKLLKTLLTQQLLEEKNGRICLTEYGIDISNYVLAQFLED